MLSALKVPPRKAANIRKSIGEIATIPPDVPVRYARKPRTVTATEHALKHNVPGSDAKCVAAVSAADQGTPALVRRREVAVLEPTKTGELVITVYSKPCLETDHYDETGDTTNLHKFEFYAWPRSWRPGYRQRLAQRRRDEIKNGAKVKHRTTPRAVQQTAVRLTSFA